MDTTKNVEPTEKEKVEKFARSYQELCDKSGYRIVVSPAYVARDDGSFSTVLQYTVGKLPRVE